MSGCADFRPTPTNPIHPLGVGEVVLRVADIHRSISFYRDVLGFPLIRVLHNSIAFMRVADGVAGHTQIIGHRKNRYLINAAIPRISKIATSNQMTPIPHIMSRM
jgi:catechol 2,3-dioxygenase-like lactoylglutathione lyase family enzyme